MVDHIDSHGPLNLLILLSIQIRSPVKPVMIQLFLSPLPGLEQEPNTPFNMIVKSGWRNSKCIASNKSFLEYFGEPFFYTVEP